MQPFKHTNTDSCVAHSSKANRNPNSYEMSFHAIDVDERAKMLQTLQTETEEIKNRLVAVSARCHELENMKLLTSQDYKATSDVEAVQELLRDALEKNQQWLAYDQQREAFVTTVLTRVHQLEQQQGLMSSATPQQQQQPRSPASEARTSQVAQQQYAEVLKTCEEQLDQEFKSIAQAQRDVEHLNRKLEDGQEELCRVQSLLQSKRSDLERTQAHVDGKKAELERLWQQIQEKNGDLSEVQELLHSKCGELEVLQSQVQATQGELQQAQREKNQIQQQLRDHKAQLRKDMTSQDVLHKHKEEQARTATLQKQVSRLAEEVQEQTCEKQRVQKQLQKALKDLNKAHNYISKLEDELDKVQSKPVSCEEQSQAAEERQDRHARRSHQSPKASPGLASPLDDSFLECPNCQLQYPASRHRELVTHIDQCCR